MLKELGKYFDSYIINARFMPAFLSVLPFVLTMLAWCPSSKSILGGSPTVLISFGVMTFISIFISNLGNKCQKKLFSIWDGAPTTAILRHRDQTLDKYTKQRYHKWLNGKIDGLNLPKVEDELKDQDDADLKYQSAINFLREFTRDKTKYPAVYRDNVAYGFARNLLSIRVLGLLIALICIVINLYLVWSTLSTDQSNLGLETFKNYLFEIGSGFFSLLFFFVFLLIVNGDFVKERGLRYGKTLLESCEIDKCS
jgi:hypothetical protein